MKHLVQKQVNGEPLDGTTTKIDYVLKSQSGRIVMGFMSGERACAEGERRKLDVFRITTISEKIG